MQDGLGVFLNASIADKAFNIASADVTSKQLQP